MNRLVPTLITMATLTVSFVRTAEPETPTKEALISQIEKFGVNTSLPEDPVEGYYAIRLASATELLKEKLEEFIASCEKNDSSVIEANAFGIYLNAKRYQRICDDAGAKNSWETSKTIIKQTLVYATAKLSYLDAASPRVTNSLERYIQSLEEPAERMQR